jgi:hypothetical protein
MSTHTPTGFNWVEAMQPLEHRRGRARVVASFAEYIGRSTGPHVMTADRASWADRGRRRGNSPRPHGR